MRLEGNILHLDEGEKIIGESSTDTCTIIGPAGPYRVLDYGQENEDDPKSPFLFSLQGDGDKHIEVRSPIDSIEAAIIMV